MPGSQQTSKPTIAITGASGLIGHRVTHRLTDEFNLIGLDTRSPDDAVLPLDHIDTDLTDDQSVRDSFAKIRERYGDRLASVVHLAAYYDFSGEPSPMYEELTVEGTRRTMEVLHELQFQVEQFVFSSSMLAMKPDDNGRHISEMSPTRAEWAYPQSKLDAEAIIRETHGDIPYVILRISGVYDEECHSLPISQQIARIYEKQLESYVYPGDASHGQSLVHLDDLADCVAKVVERRTRLAPDELFLIAEPDVMSYEELQDRIGELVHGSEWPTIRIPKVVAKAGAYVKGAFADEDESFIKPWMIDLADDHYAANVAHAQSTLDWHPKHRLRDTLPRMIEFLKRDPEAFYKTNKLPLPESLSKSED